MGISSCIHGDFIYFSTSKKHTIIKRKYPFSFMASQDSQTFHWHRYPDLDDNNFQVHGQGLFIILILFSLLLFSTLLCLFAKWVCRYRQFSATSVAISRAIPHQNLPMAQTQTQTQTRSRSNGLHPTTIESLPIILYHSSTTNTTINTDETQCSICLCAFQDEEKIKVLPKCNHTFHPGCVDPWLLTQSSCPLCRASLRVDSAISEG